MQRFLQSLEKRPPTPLIIDIHSLVKDILLESFLCILQLAIILEQKALDELIRLIKLRRLLSSRRPEKDIAGFFRRLINVSWRVRAICNYDLLAAG